MLFDDEHGLEARITLSYKSEKDAEAVANGVSPDNVKLYYTKDGGTSWTLAGEDNSVDSTFDYNITSGDGTYGWNAVAIGGGSTENDPPPPGTPPEAAPLILDASPILIAPANCSWINDNTPTFEWVSVISPVDATYQIQIDDNLDFISPVYFAAGLTDNNHTLPDENALAASTYFWRVRAVDNEENAGNWSTVWTLFIITGNCWEQTNWVGGPTKPSLQVGTWDKTYDNFYDNDNVNWSDGVRLDHYYVIADHVVISEIFYDESSYDNNEFVELYNPTDHDIDIGGWQLKSYNQQGIIWANTAIDGDVSGTTVIKSHGFYLVGEKNPLNSIDWGGIPITPDDVRSHLRDWQNGPGDYVVLEKADGTYVDGVRWGAKESGDDIADDPFYEDVGPSNSIERKSSPTHDETRGNGYDTDDASINFRTRNFPEPQNSSSTLEEPIVLPVPRFRLAGWLESSIYDTGDLADWKYIIWIENKPSGTSIIVKARTGNDNNPYDGGWSGWYQHSNGAENALMENRRYVQYRVELSTTDNSETPKLSQITLIYELLENIRGVDVSISPSFRVGANGATLIYTVTVNNIGNVSDTYTLDNTDNLGWTKSLSNTSLVMTGLSSDNTTTLSVTIPMGAAVGTIDNITVTANGTGVSDSASCTAQVIIPGVEVNIENKLLEGWTGKVLDYPINVHNSGNIVDNIILSVVPDGWPIENIYLDQSVFNEVAPCETIQTKLYVHVPDNAVPCTYKEITVVAESQLSGATDNDSALAHVSDTPAILYTYVSSYSAVKGTVTDFANQQSADDGGAYSTLAERFAIKGDLIFTEGFEHGGEIPAGWTFENNFEIDNTTTHVHSGTFSASVMGKEGSTNTMISNLIDYTISASPHLSFCYKASPATENSWIKVDASIDGGVTWTVPVVAQFYTVSNSTWYLKSDDQDLSSLAGKPNVRFRWTLYKMGMSSSYVAFDDILFTATGTPTYDMDIYENITGILAADNHTLEMRYELANTNDTFNVQVWDGSAWNTRGADLTSTSWMDWSYPLLDNEVISGTVQVRFVDNNENSTTQDIILKDYLRVKNEKTPYCGVQVTIEKALLEGWPGQVLAYTIKVHNSGNVVDNINLSHIPDGWDNITIVPQVLTDFTPFGHSQVTMFVRVPDNAVPCTYKGITVVAESQFCGATDNDTAQVHVIPIPACGVDVTIENKLLEGWPSQVLEYTIDVYNSGEIIDNINLSYIPDGWQDITIVPQVLIDVPENGHRQATMSVHVPDCAEPCTYKEITVVAESQFCGATDNDNATAHVQVGCWVDVIIENKLLE